MALSIFLAVVAAGLFVMAVLFIRAVEAGRSWVGARTFRMHFPRDTEPQAVVTFLAGLSGLRRSWYARFAVQPTVIFEVHAVHGRIEHYLLIPRPLTGVVLSHLRAALPSVRLDPPEPQAVPAVTHALELGISARGRSLRVEQAVAVASALLTSLQPLRPHEQAVVQWIISPAPLARPPRLSGKSSDPFPKVVATTGDGYELLPHAEALRAERSKQAEPLFMAVGRLGIAAGTPSRGRYLVDRFLASYQLLSASGVELKPRRLITPTAAVRRIMRRSVPLLEWPTSLNAAELAGVIGWPVGVSQLPALVLGGCRQLPPDADIPSAGCVIGQATFPGSERPVAIRPEDRLLHLSVTGPTGTGKSNLLLNLITQDMQAGRGVVVVDPKGDLVTECLKRVPPARVKDVIVIDPADEDRPVGINLLDADAASAELVVEHVVFVFHQLFSAFWGPRTDDVMRAGLLTLMRRPGMTLLELPLLLTNKTWRAPFVSAVQDDIVGLAPFWVYYEALKPNDQANVIAPLMNKLRATLLRTKVRHCIGQAAPRFNLGDALDNGKLIFLPLRQGLLGDEASKLLGSLFVARVWQTIQARSGVAESQRRQVHLYIDEAHAYVNLPTSLGDMLAQARGLGLAVTLATQHLTQWPAELRQDVLNNCRSHVVFQTSADDAAKFAKEFKPYLTSEDLQGLGRYEIVAQLAVGQRVAPPVTGVTFPPPPEAHRSASAMAWSRQHYGQNRDELEAAMRDRQTVAPSSEPIGRQRRTRRAS